MGRVAAVLAASLWVVACSSSEPGPSVVGVVTSVTGDLQQIDQFEVRLDDGSTLRVVPRPGLTFDGGPLSHLFDHLRTGQPVRMSIVRDAGEVTAQAIGDAG